MTRVKLTNNGKPSETLPNEICVYFCYETEDAIVPTYIGSTVNLQQRWTDHHKREQLKDCYLEWLTLPTISEANKLEQSILSKLKPEHNTATKVQQRTNCHTSKLYVWVDQETKADLERLKQNTGQQYASLSHMIRVWINEKLQEYPEL